MITKKSPVDYEEPKYTDWIETLHKRQGLLYRNIPKCPKCDSEQVQLLRLNKPARWRCKVCKHRFEKEP